MYQKVWDSTHKICTHLLMLLLHCTKTLQYPKLLWSCQHVMQVTLYVTVWNEKQYSLMSLIGQSPEPALAGDVTLVTLWHVWCCQDTGVRWQWWCPHVTEGHSVTWAPLSLLVRIRNTGSGDRKLSFSCQQETELSAGQNTNQHRDSSAMDVNHHPLISYRLCISIGKW